MMMKLLLVDDDAFLRDMYAHKFSECGYEVETADSGVSALTKIKQNPDYDLVMMDMIMPGMTGVELIREIKEKYPKMEAKCVILSNQGNPEDIKEAKKVGADDYIVKAESVPSDVVNKVNKLFKK